MSEFDQELNRRAEHTHKKNLWRELRRIDSAQGPRIKIDGRIFLNFSSNDYLGLASHPLLKEAAIRAIQQFGAGAGASRLISGSLGPHADLDEALAAFKGTEAALSFSSGYATAIGVICALVEKGDIIVMDKLVHASIVDAARLSGAKLRVFAHNDLNELEDILRWATGTRTSEVSSGRKPHILIATESVFSMDGDLAPLPDLIALKEKYGAWLMLDEAHATGVFGDKRRGLAELAAPGVRIEIQMGTLGKALGAAGGYVCGSRALIDYLVNRARSFIFSTAPPPAAVAAARAGVELVQSDEGEARQKQLWRNLVQFRQLMGGSRGRDLRAESAIVPVRVGDEAKALEAAAALREKGIFVPAVRYPTVARGSARLRLSFTSAHAAEDIAQLHSAFQETNAQA